MKSDAVNAAFVGSLVAGALLWGAVAGALVLAWPHIKAKVVGDLVTELRGKLGAVGGLL